jgi:predicted nucleic acid-binding protein
VDLIVLDAGVLIAILDANDAHHERARQELTTSRDRGDRRLVIPASAYAEILVAAFRESPEASATIDEFLDALPATVEPATREIGRRAAELRARHGNRLRLPDALVAATGIVLKADRIMTTDARWPDVGVTVHVIGDSSG